LSKLTADQSTATTNANALTRIGNRPCGREDLPAVLSGKLDALPRNVRVTTSVPIGIYRGLRFGLVLHPQFPSDVYLEGSVTRQSGLSRDHQGPRAVLNALERLANAYGSECVQVRQDLTIAEAQLRDYQARLGKPFAHNAYLSDLTSLRDQLKAGLSASSHESGSESVPSISELAEKIKSLKTANSIEGTPQRARQKHSSAEEPVTARIRRRAESKPVPDQAVETNAARAEHALPPTQESPRKPPLTFQERIVLERQHKDDGQSPP
jgi:hypothetical protein